MTRVIRDIIASHPVHGARGGVAVLMLIGFIALAVPVTIAAVQSSGQLSRNSRVYDTRLTGMYNSGSAIEVALHKILADPSFDVGLTPSSPSKAMTAEANGETVNITVTKIFTSNAVDGQGLVVSKVVSPTSTPVDTATTFTYTITIKNEGTGTSEIEEIKDFLPPGMVYATSSTSGITTNEPVVRLGAVKKVDHFLNHDGAVPYPWDPNQGSDNETGQYTPADGVWEEVAEYWETAPYPEDGVIRATDWEHKQWIKAAQPSSKWRWKLQRNRGGAITDLFTSSDQTLSTSWTEKQLTHNSGDIAIQSGDKLRLRLEVWAANPDPANRLIEYRWGGDEPSGPDYNSRTKIPRIAYCTNGDQYELKWTFGPRVLIQSQEELTLTFQVDATLPDGTYYNQGQAKYRPSWDLGNDVKTYSPNEAGITVGTGTPKCSHVGEVLVTKVADVQETDPGVETTVTYTVTFENTSPVTMWLCDFSDYLPPGFDYEWGSYTGDIDRDPHLIHWEEDEQRNRPHWKKDQYPENGSLHMFPISAGVTKSFTFEALATLEQGITYFNETDAKFSDNSACEGGTKARGGTTASASTSAKTLYDVQAVAADGTVKARVQLTSLAGVVDILSWQEQ